MFCVYIMDVAITNGTDMPYILYMQVSSLEGALQSYTNNPDDIIRHILAWVEDL